MERVGRRLLLGAPAGAIGEDALALVQKTGAMGLVLFRSQLTQPAYLPQQLTWLRERLGRPLVIAIDHEGGQVIRHLERSTIWPGNYALGRVAEGDLTQAESWAEQVGMVMGGELRMLGIGWNLAPVLDVVGTRPNPGLGLRAFGRNSEPVTRLGLAMLRGFFQAGIVSCGKHFPGLGCAQVDPHHELPRLDLSLFELATHWQPFRGAIQAGLPSVMTTHVLVPVLDENHVITLSHLAIQKYLRQELEFTGVVVSDDLDMGAMRSFGNLGEITLKTLQAGHDLAIIGQPNPAEIPQLLQTLAAAEAGGKLPEHEASLARIDRLMAQVDIAQMLPSAQDWQPAVLLADAISRAAVRVLRDPQGWLAVKSPVRLYLPDVTPVADWVLFEPGWFDPLQMANWLGMADAEVMFTALYEPTVLRLNSVSQITNVLILYDACRFPGQQQVLDQLAQSGQPLVVVLVRNPWDGERVPAEITLIDAAGFRSPQLRQVGRVLRGMV